MILKKYVALFFFIVAVCNSLFAQSPFTPGNIVVVRVGAGDSLTNASTAVFLDEYTTGGSLVQSVAIPASSSGSNAPLTLSGTAASEGSIVNSADGRYLTLAGYGIAPGTASVNSSTSATVNRVVARIDASASIDITTKLTDASTGNNIRGAVTNDGNAFWISGAAGGVRYAALGATTSTQLSTTPVNNRVINIFNNQLYVTSNKSSCFGISSVGSGLPATSGQTITLLSGFPTSTASPDGFSKNGNTIYVADDRTDGNGGVQKWTYNGSSWSLAYVLVPSASTGAIGLSVDWTSANPIIYATTTDNKIVTVIDAGSSSSFTTLVTGATNTLLHGVSFTPIPFISFTNGTSYTPSAGTPNTNDNPIGKFKLAGNISGGKLNQVVVTLSGTYSGIANLKLYYSPDTTFSVGTSTLLATVASPSSTVTFNISSTPQPISTSGGYFYIAADLNSSAAGTAMASLDDQTKLTFANASLNGTFANAKLSLVYSLNVNSSHGTVTKTPDQQNYPFGSTVQLTANPVDSSYHFAAWSGDVPAGHETDNPLTVTMSQIRTITASFALNTSAPILILPTATNIASITAILGSKIISNGNDSLIERGIVWSTSANPTTADNKVSTPDTNSLYTVAVNSLPAGSFIHFRGYAINGIGTGYSSDATFYTLSLEPSAHADSLTANAVSAYKINLSWKAAAGATGFIILQRVSSDPTGLPMDAAGYAVGDTIGDGTVAALLMSNTATSASITGLTASTSYHYSIISFAWDGLHPGTYNYKTNGTIPTANATTPAGPQLIAVILPKYIQGNTGTNSNRLPFAYRARLTGLLPGSLYRFMNQVVVSTDAATSNGSGNCIFASSTVDFVRTSGPSLAAAGNYGTLTTDGTGAYEGWFITEPTGNRRFIPGKYVFMRITLNDGAGGTTAALLLTTADSVRVVKLDPAASDSTGTGLRGTSSSNPKNFIFVYGDTAGTGRPISGSFIESDGTDNSTTNNYVAFYNNNVNGMNGAYGMVLPNMLPNGIRRIEQRSLINGTLVTSATDTDGVWPSGAHTVNPSGGTTEIVFTGTDTGIRGTSTIPKEFSLLQNYPNPFNPQTTISYSLPQTSTVTLKVYDLMGREIVTLIQNERKAPGNYEISFNALNLSSGVYFYKLQTQSYVQTKRMILLK